MTFEDGIESAAVALANSAADAALAEATTVANDEAGAVTTAAGQEATAVSGDGSAQATFVTNAGTAEATFEQGKAAADRDYDNAVAQAGVDYVATLGPEEATWFLWWDNAGGAPINISADMQDAINGYLTAVAQANVTRVTAIGNAELAQAQTDGGAEVTLGTSEGGLETTLVSGLVGDSESLAGQLAGADELFTSTVTGAASSTAVTLAQAAATWTKSYGTDDEQAQQTLGSNETSTATNVANAQADYAVATATNNETSAQTFANNSQGGPNAGAANFQADWAQEYVDWLKNVRAAFVNDSTTVAGDDATYQETVAGLGDSLANEIAGEQVIFTQADAPAAATEANSLDAANDDYSVSVVDHLGDDANATANADSTWDIALANAASAYLLANAQADKDSQIAYAQIPLGGSALAAGSTYIQETADAELALTKSQADADLAWVTSKATADSGFLTADASSWDGMIHTESQAVDDFAHADDAANKTLADAIGAAQAATMVPEAQADATQQSGDAAADDDFMEAEANQSSTDWIALAGMIGTPWAQEQAEQASANASWSSTEASNYQSYIGKLGAAETAYATSDAAQFLDEVTKIDAANQTDGDAAADANQTLANALADDETAVEQAAAAASATYWVAIAQANHDYRIAATQAWHDEEVGGSFADYNTAMSTAAGNLSVATNAAITQFHATVDPVATLQASNDADATLTHDTAIADDELDDFIKAIQAQDAYSDLESGDFDAQQHTDNQAFHDLTVDDANGEAASMASFDQANPSPWADEASAEAQAQATQTDADADAALTVDNQAADAQEAQEIAQADAAAARDIAYAQIMHDQSVVEAQKVHDLSTGTGVSAPNPITPPDDGTPSALTADYGGGFEAGNLWLSDTMEDFYSLPLQVPSGGEMEEPNAGGLVTDMALGAMPLNGQQPYYGMLYGIIQFNGPMPYATPGYYFFDGVSIDSAALYGDGNPSSDLPPGSAAALASTNWSNGVPSPQAPNASFSAGPSFLAQQGGGANTTSASQTSGAGSSAGGTQTSGNETGANQLNDGSQTKDTARIGGRISLEIPDETNGLPLYVNLWGNEMMQNFPPEQWMDRVDELQAFMKNNGTPLSAEHIERLRTIVSGLQADALARAKITADMTDTIRKAQAAKPQPVEVARPLTQAEKDFIVRIIEAIFFHNTSDPGAAREKLRETLDNAQLVRGPGSSIVARVALQDPANEAITLEERKVYIQSHLFPGPIDEQDIRTKRARDSLLLILHESVHLQQQAMDESGIFFYLAYIYGAARWGYDGEFSEIEAFAVQDAAEALLTRAPNTFYRALDPDEVQKLRARSTISYRNAILQILRFSRY